MVNHSFRLLLCLLTAIALSGCNKPRETDADTSGDFILTGSQPAILQEGDLAGVTIDLQLQRIEEHSAPVSLSIEGVSKDDSASITTQFQRSILDGENNSWVNINLGIADLPILAQQRDFVITATDGETRSRLAISVAVRPVQAPDVYLLIGQSNMTGFSGDGTKNAVEDATHPRIKQLNVTENLNDQFQIPADFTDKDNNVISAQPIVLAEDPLHIPLDPNNTGKDLAYIGMGLSFAKAAIDNTSQDIILVPAAWSGSAFCANDNGPVGQWNAGPTNNSNLGNSLLFDRAVARTNFALDETGGILRGILWHQGESDGNENCAPVYQANLERMIRELRLQIQTDARGGDLRRAEANIPFVLGTMSRGVDTRDDLSSFYPAKQAIDDVHFIIPSVVPYAALSNNINLVPAQGFPCGNTSCIHFGPAALRNMGRQYYDQLKIAASQ